MVCHTRTHTCATYLGKNGVRANRPLNFCLMVRKCGKMLRLNEDSGNDFCVVNGGSGNSFK